MTAIRTSRTFTAPITIRGNLDKAIGAAQSMLTRLVNHQLTTAHEPVINELVVLGERGCENLVMTLNYVEDSDRPGPTNPLYLAPLAWRVINQHGSPTEQLMAALVQLEIDYNTGLGNVPPNWAVQTSPILSFRIDGSTVLFRTLAHSRP